MAKVGYARVSTRVKVLMDRLIHLKNMVVKEFLVKKLVGVSKNEQN